uniref:Uncharacterized protein n=1 Tax=Anguilla anguilla TaxID=7936 RepID=A0A0E9X7K3_ANGAN
MHKTQDKQQQRRYFYPWVLPFFFLLFKNFSFILIYRTIASIYKTSKSAMLLDGHRCVPQKRNEPKLSRQMTMSVIASDLLLGGTLRRKIYHAGAMVCYNVGKFRIVNGIAACRNQKSDSTITMHQIPMLMGYAFSSFCIAVLTAI